MIGCLHKKNHEESAYVREIGNNIRYNDKIDHIIN